MVDPVIDFTVDGRRYSFACNEANIEYDPAVQHLAVRSLSGLPLAGPPTPKPRCLRARGR